MPAASVRAAIEAEVRRHVEAGDAQGALAAALGGLGPELMGFLSVLAGNADDAGEVFADVCVRIWKSLPGFRWESSLRTWAYVIARRAFLVHLKRRVAMRDRQVPLSNVPDEISALVAKVRTSTRTRVRKEQQTRIERLRGRLAPDDQALLTLRVDRELEWKDIARILAERDDLDDTELRRTAAGLRKRFERLKDSLRRMMADEGEDPETS